MEGRRRASYYTISHYAGSRRSLGASSHRAGFLKWIRIIYNIGLSYEIFRAVLPYEALFFLCANKKRTYVSRANFSDGIRIPLLLKEHRLYRGNH